MKRLLAALDFSPVTDLVVQTTRELALALGATVRLIHVAPPEPDFVGYEAGPITVRQRVAAEYREARRRAHSIESRLRNSGLAVEAMVVQGEPADKILHHAREFGADLIVLGSHGHGMLYELLVGSVTSAVMRAAPCPVVVVPSPRMGRTTDREQTRA